MKFKNKNNNNQMFAQNTIESLNGSISTFTTAVGTKFNISKDDVYKLWTLGKVEKKIEKSIRKNNSKATGRDKKSDSKSDSKSCEHQMGKTAKNPGQLCGAYTVFNNADGEPTTGRFCKKHLGDEKEKKKKKDTNDMIESINRNAKELTVVKNKFNNYVEHSTNFVFGLNQKVIGKQVDNNVEPLSEADINLCKCNNWAYEVPTTIKTDGDKKLNDDNPLVSSDDDMGSEDDEDEKDD